jgi:Na+/H+ antiporter NhaD/arsenite permease-like protein
VQASVRTIDNVNITAVVGGDIVRLLAVAMASNIGSTATITGNPQNMMIGSFSQIPYAQFTASLVPVALVGLVLSFVLIALFHRGEFGGGARLLAEPPPARTYRVLMVRALVATTVLVALFPARPVPVGSQRCFCSDDDRLARASNSRCPGRAARGSRLNISSPV